MSGLESVPVLLWLGVLVVPLGLLAVLLRRSLVIVTGGMLIAFMGVAVVFVAAAGRHQDQGGLARAALVLFSAFVIAAVGGAAAIASYRQRGTVNLDEQREMRG
jgi:NADH:ubiquinone oxidoreductase subunit K